MVSKEDIAGIVGGLKNAMERGSSLEKAKMTFINAGYNPEDIDEAARTLMPLDIKKQLKVSQSLTLTTTLQKLEKPEKIEAKEKLPEKLLPELPMPEFKKKKKFGIRTVLIVIAVIILLLILNLLRAMLGINF